jgi:hypothetical protein
MGEVIAYLRQETEKNEHLIEELLALYTLPSGEIEKAKLVKVIINSYRFYASVEKIRESHPKWVLVSENRIYNLMRALIQLDTLPPFNGFPGFCKKISASVVAGYMYVFHVFQMHTHSIGRFLENHDEAHENVFRAFTFIQEDLTLRSQFLDQVRAEIDFVDKTGLTEGVRLAFSEIKRYPA